MHLAFSPNRWHQIECHAGRHDLIFRSNQFHSVTTTLCLCGLSFVKVIEIRLKCFTDMAPVWVFGCSPAIRRALSLVFLSFLKPSSDCVSLDPVNYRGSLQVQGQSKLWGRSNGKGSAPTPNLHLTQPPSAEAAMVIANNYLCNVWCLDVSLSQCVLWLVYTSCISQFLTSVFHHFSELKAQLSVEIWGQSSPSCFVSSDITV